MTRPTWTKPYSVARLVRLCKTWDFHSDGGELPDADDGEPRLIRRLSQWMRARRDAFDGAYDPWDHYSIH